MAVLTIANNSTTQLTFDSERWDTDGMHSTSTNTGRLTCVTSGLYLVFANVQWVASAPPATRATA